MGHVEVQKESMSDVHDLVVRASLASYEAVGQRGVPFWEHADEGNGQHPDIVLPRLRRVEEVETEESFDSLDWATAASLRRADMELWVVVPQSRMAVAHEKLRGLADRIQPWFFEGGQPMFGRPRVP
jgi:hypothetical protein